MRYIKNINNKTNNNNHNINHNKKNHYTNHERVNDLHKRIIRVITIKSAFSGS